MMTHKEKILIFVGSTGLNKTQFCKKCNLSNGYLDSKGSITSDKLVSILENFRDLSLDWLLFNEGEMIVSTEEKKSQKENSSKSDNRKTLAELNLLAVNTKVDNLSNDFSKFKEGFLELIEEKLEKAIKNKEI